MQTCYRWGLALGLSPNASILCCLYKTFCGPNANHCRPDANPCGPNASGGLLSHWVRLALGFALGMSISCCLFPCYQMQTLFLVKYVLKASESFERMCQASFKLLAEPLRDFPISYTNQDFLYQPLSNIFPYFRNSSCFMDLRADATIKAHTH